MKIFFLILFGLYAFTAAIQFPPAEAAVRCVVIALTLTALYWIIRGFIAIGRQVRLIFKQPSE